MPDSAAVLDILPTLDLFVQKGGDLDSRNAQGWTLLHEATWNGQEDIVRYLLDKGAAPTASNENGSNALHLATWKGHSSIVQRLLERAVDPNETNNEGETPLHQAAWLGYVDIVRLLLDDAGDPDHRDDGSREVVRLFLNKGADPRIEDNDGRKPHSLAEENSHHPTAKVLRDMETEVFGYPVAQDVENIPITRHPNVSVDSAILAALSAPEGRCSIEPYGQASCSTSGKLTLKTNERSSHFFLKTDPDGEVFRGEYESLASIHAAVPTLCPRPIAHGTLDESPDSLLLTDFVGTENSSNGRASSGLSLAQKLALLRKAPVPTPTGFSTHEFGFHTTTSTGSTAQDNSWNSSWFNFYAQNRLRAVWEIVERNHGEDEEIQS
ncbi:MAG: hypothetical protein Q9228_004029 [Teloschistes exilis]